MVRPCVDRVAFLDDLAPGFNIGYPANREAEFLERTRRCSEMSHHWGVEAGQCLLLVNDCLENSPVGVIALSLQNLSASLSTQSIDGPSFESLKRGVFQPDASGQCRVLRTVGRENLRLRPVALMVSPLTRCRRRISAMMPIDNTPDSPAKRLDGCTPQGWKLLDTVYPGNLESLAGCSRFKGYHLEIFVPHVLRCRGVQLAADDTLRAVRLASHQRRPGPRSLQTGETS